MQVAFVLKIRHVRIPHGGVLGFIEGKKSSGRRTLLLRADMDALPIQENPMNLSEKKLSVSKIEGVSHACGHDGHLAMLLTEAKILKRMEDDFSGRILLLFEESEEVGLEIENICKYIEENEIAIDSCYATHVRWDIPAGKVLCLKGVAMHGMCLFRIEIHGKSGHGARPDLGNSTIDCFNQFYNFMNQLRMKKVAPDRRFTWSVGELSAGKAENVLPDYLKCSGTYRFSDVQDGRNVFFEMKKILDCVCGLCGCTYSIEPEQFMLPVTNDFVCADLFEKACNEAAAGNEENLALCGAGAVGMVEPWMASETFNYFSSMYPSIYTYTGIKNEKLGSGANHHTPEFDLDEKGLVHGIACAVSYVLEFFRTDPDLSGFTPIAGSMSELVASLHSF